jgi:galactokinase
MIFRAPGRVNLIGEHTDYNLGFVLPIALEMATYVETHPSPDGRFHVSSNHKQGTFSWSPEETANLRPSRQWTDYVIGVARQFPLGEPLEMTIRSDVPEGSGLSSSAALEVSSALAFLQGREFDPLELARLCQRAESEFVGMPCGIMDQYVSIFGQPHAAIRIDCRSLTHETVTLPDDLEIIAINSMVKHELGASAYRVRVRECAEACAAIGVKSLRDATLEQAQPFPRARHIVSENLRVEAFVEAAARSDQARMGRLFVESHRSMQYDYEITCEEVDFLVDTAIEIPGCYGARMTGGGFGGCTVNLVAPERAAAFEHAMKAAYRQRFQIDPTIFRCVPGPGAGIQKT